MNEISFFRLYLIGVPGTGKTSVGKELSKRLDLELVEINDVIIEKRFFLGYDIDRDSLIIDNELLIPFINTKVDNTKKLCLIGGLVDLKDKFDTVILLHCRADILRERLAARGYSSEKVEANVEAEIMNVLYYDAIEFFGERKVMEINNDTTSINETCEKIILKIREHHPSVIEGLDN